MKPYYLFTLVALLLSVRPAQASNDRFLCRPLGTVINYFFYDPNYVYGDLFPHTGIDFDAYHGQTIRAAAGGTVIDLVRPSSTDYAYIIIEHKNNISTLYGHVSKIKHLQIGQHLKKGKIIAEAGGTPGSNGAGKYSTGPHLHFEVRLDNVPVRPNQYWAKTGKGNVCTAPN